MSLFTLTPGQLSLAQLRAAYQAPLQLRLDASAHAAIEASVACVNGIIAEGRTAYGINTGFGLLASTRIATEDLEKLQRSLVLSHAAGIGEPLDDAMVRLIMLLKVNSLARGFSGIRLPVIEALIALINAEVYPLSRSRARWAPPAIWRRWRICRWCCWARARHVIAVNGCRQPRRWPWPVSSR